MIQRRRIALLLASLIAWPFGAVLAAADLRLHDQFRQSVWTVERGAPADIWALAQDRDGFLWLGTGAGLYRFDGVDFERFVPKVGESLPANDITALSVQSDGSLWIGLFRGGASVLRDGHLTSYAEPEGFPGSMVLAFARAGDGSLWAASRGGLVRFDGHRWRVAGADWGYPATRADWVMADRDGTLWVTTGEELLFLRPGAARFERTGIRTPPDTTLAQAPDGRLWLTDGPQGARALPGPTAAPAAPVGGDAGTDALSAVHAKRLLFDRGGHLWGTDAVRGGVFRVDAPAAMADGRPLRAAAFDALYDRGAGLPSNVAVPMLEDREGSLWVGTNQGLVSYHRNNVLLPPDTKIGPGINSALAIDDTGTAWLANGGALRRLDATHAQVQASGLPDIYAMLNASGSLWLIGNAYLARLEHGQPIPVPVPVADRVWHLEAVAGDDAGGLWASFLGHGLYRLHDGAWTRVGQGEGLDDGTPTALLGDGAGRLWAGYANGRVLYLDGPRRRSYGAAQGLAVGSIASFSLHGGELLVGGDDGVARLEGERFRTLRAAGPPALIGVSGIVRTAQGDAWINGSRGVLHFTAAELARGFAGQPATYEGFDYHDGLPGIALQATPVSTAGQDGAGRLWFNTNQGLAWIDPARVQHNPLAPATFVQTLVAGEQRYATAGEPQLPPRTGAVRLQYTATSLAMPDRVRFRYRLDGADEDWQDGGTQREATYTHLGPGRYRFRVIAANDDGVWNEQGGHADFVILPMFYQTLWFRLLCVAAGLAAAVALYLWRLRLMTERIRLRLDERTGERERIARELHDTLLQGVQGLLLRLQALAAELPVGDARRRSLDAAIERARDMLVQGRDKIVALRGSQPREHLAQAVRVVGEELTAIHGAPFRVLATGTERTICPPVCDELLDIVREAMRNASMHARATIIDVVLAYQPNHLRMVVRDDGRGIDPDVLESGRADGRWGLVGMRERAAKLGATLDVRRVTPHGTEVALTVPGAVAYSTAPQRKRRRRPDID
jgi:signal transduction histidine kinase/ligand-binding sensor domain-containing protein